jgi:hypothetical protein
MTLKYREIYERLQGASYPDQAARDAAYMSAQYYEAAERRRQKGEQRAWLGQLDGWFEEDESDPRSAARTYNYDDDY